MREATSNNEQQKENITPSELVHRHMQHPEEKITDEDIAHLKIDTSSSEEASPVDELSAELKDKNDDDNLDDDKPMVTPYDMLK